MRQVPGCVSALWLALLAAPAPLAAAGGEEAGWENGFGCGRAGDAGVASEAGSAAVAAPEAAFDAATGRDLRNWPPSPRVRFEHLRLDLDFPDLAERRFSGVATYRVSPLGLPVQDLSLDAAGMKVDSVTREGGQVEWFQGDGTLSLRFPEPLPAGPTTLVIRYQVRDPQSGMVFSPRVPGEPGKPAELHTQGQPQTNHHWFPCHDFPNVRMPTELVVTVPAGVSVSSNGKLVEQKEEGGRAVWHWLQAKPHVPYLVTLVAGDFAQVPIPNKLSGVPMHVWVPPSRAGDVERTYGNTDRMVALFNRVFGVAYPWDRYDQLVVRNFGAGGMENTSATTLQPSAIHDPAAAAEEDLDGLISHELCHQWTGDLVTCRSWAHIWLNEGWATYGSALWFEERDGPDGYSDSIHDSMGVARRDTTDGEIPMVSPIYRRPGETFSRTANPYPKGASILHMLRRMLGDDRFFDGVHRYMARHQGGTVETVDFRRALEEASGLDLEWFFDQWCMRPGCPALAVDVGYDGARRVLTVRVEQTQKIDAATPAFRLQLPIWVETEAGAVTHPLEIREKLTTAEFQLPGPPRMVAVDPELFALKTMKLSMPESLLLACAERGPTSSARRTAVAALRGSSDPGVIERLAAIAAGESARRPLRSDALDVLQGFKSPASKAAIAALFDAGVKDQRFRAEVVAALAELDPDVATPRLAAVARRDESARCRAAAAEGLGRLRAAGEVDVLLELAVTPSHQERLREAALRALLALKEPRALDAARQLAAQGMPDRSRPDGISTMGRLVAEAAKDRRDEVVKELVAYLDDPERRAANAAGEALASLKAREAIPRLEAIAASDSDPGRRDMATGWLGRIRGTEGGSNAPGAAPAGGGAAPATGAAAPAGAGDAPPAGGPRGRRRGG